MKEKKLTCLVKESMKKFFLAEWSLPEKVILMLDLLLAGVLIGWLTSPFRHGIHLFSCNTVGNTTGSNNRGQETEEDV